MVEQKGQPIASSIVKKDKRKQIQFIQNLPDGRTDNNDDDLGKIQVGSCQRHFKRAICVAINVTVIWNKIGTSSMVRLIERVVGNALNRESIEKVPRRTLQHVVVPKVDSHIYKAPLWID